MKGPRGGHAPAIYVAVIVITLGVGIVIAATLVALERHPNVIVALGSNRDVLEHSLIVAIIGYTTCMIALVVGLMMRKPNPRARMQLIPSLSFLFPVEVAVLGGLGLQEMGAFDIVYFGIGVLCVMWVVRLLFVNEDPEPVTPGPPTGAAGTSVGPSGASPVTAEPPPAAPPTGKTTGRPLSAQRSRALSVGLLVVGIGVLAAWRATQEAGLAPATQEAGLALALGSWRMSCRLPGRERGTDPNCVVLGDTQRGDIRRGDPSRRGCGLPWL